MQSVDEILKTIRAFVKSKWLSGSFGILFLFAFAASSEPAAPLFSDDLDDIRAWKTATAADVELRVAAEDGIRGKCMSMRFDFSKSRGYAMAGRDVSIALPDNYEFSFYIKGRGNRQISLEFKLMDRKGNTYWRKIPDFQFPAEWKRMFLSKDEIAFAWGPGGGDIRDVSRIEIVFSTDQHANGTGEALFDDLTLTALPQSTLTLDPKKTVVTASAVENGMFEPFMALDNNMGTRWSSPYDDPQWIQVDFGEEREIAGLIIYWEAAFGSTYDVMISPDNVSWKTVYSREQGDGGSDYVLFRKQSARSVRIHGRKRGTAWGYSILEIKFLTGEFAPEILTSSNPADAKLMLDGDPSTEWVSDNQPLQSVRMDLKNMKTLGGLILRPGANPIVGRIVSISPDGETWKEILRSRKKAVDVDYLFFPEFNAKYLKIDIEAERGPVSIREMVLTGGDEKLTPQKAFEVASLQAPNGFYPRWLKKQQEYWTVMGVPDDDKESLLSECGVLEPWHFSYTFVPVLKTDAGIITYADVETVQSLDEGFLPIPKIVWKGNGVNLAVEAFGADSGQRSSTYAAYTVTNTSARRMKGEFYLLLRPFQLNPPWMGGGLAEIESIKYDRTKPSMMRVNGRSAIYVPHLPARYGVAAFQRPDGYGDIIEDIHTGTFRNSAAEFRDPEKLGSAALGYDLDLDPGASATFSFIVPLHDTSHEIDLNLDTVNSVGHVEEKKAATREFWKTKLGGVRIELPDQEFVNTLKSNIAYILINDDMFRLQPGSRNYEASWMRDGSITATALLSMGLMPEVKRYLNWITGFVQSDGWVPFIVDSHDKITSNNWKEFDSQGQYIYAILQYYLFTKDRAFLSDKKQKFVDDIRFIKARRAERKTAEYERVEKREFYGIFPESQSHEGYINPPRHSYWDDFWGLRGLNDAVRAFRILGDEEKAAWADEERREFQECVYDSLKIVFEKKKIDFIPGCAELGDPDPTSTANGLWPCNEMPNMPPDRMRRTFDMYWENLSARFNPDWKGGFTPYEIRVANPYILMGRRDRLYRMLTKFFEWKRPRNFNHWAEVVTSEYRLAQYLGDMPHTWIGAEFVNVIRNMLILEDGDALYLARGVPAEWCKPGDAVKVTGMPTHFGDVTYAMKAADDGITVDVSSGISGAGKVVFAVPPAEGRITSVDVNGASYGEWRTGEVVLKDLPARIVFHY